MAYKRSMKAPRSALLLLATAFAGGTAACAADGTDAGDGALPEIGQSDQELHDGHLPNNFPFLNGAGTAATFSTAGFVDLNNPFHVPQGTNGRSCESCHLPHAGCTHCSRMSPGPEMSSTAKP